MTDKDPAMAKRYMFAERDGKATEVKIDPRHLDRQIRDLQAAGYTVTVLDQDERITFGLIAQQLRSTPPPTQEPTADEADPPTATYTTPDGTVLPDDGRRYALSGPRGVSPFLDRLSPHAEQHTITVYGTADLARRLAEADQAGVCVAWRDITHDTAAGSASSDDDTDEM